MIANVLRNTVTVLKAATLSFVFLAASSAAQAGDSLLPTLPKAKGEQCVEPHDVMRRRHFEFLMHQRDDTMHAGIRTEQHSLKGCLSCHTAKNDAGEYIPVNAEGQFCAACHSFAAVTIDCWECHATTPGDGPKAKGANPH